MPSINAICSWSDPLLPPGHVVVFSEDGAVRDSLRQLLEIQGREVREASSPSEILQDERDALRCIVIDPGGTVETAMPLLLDLRRQDAKSPIVLVADALAHSGGREIPSGPIVIIGKPLARERLAAALSLLSGETR